MKDNGISHPFYLQIQREINRVEKKVDLFNFLFYFVRVIQILFGGLITVISGINNNETNSDIILFLGAIITVLAAIESLFKIDSKRNTYKIILFELRSIRSEMVFKLMVSEEKKENLKLDEDSMITLYERYKKANLYAHDILGTDTEKGKGKIELVSQS